MAKSPRTKIAESVSPLLLLLVKLGFSVEAKLNADNEGKVEWKKKPPKE